MKRFEARLALNIELKYKRCDYLCKSFKSLTPSNLPWWQMGGLFNHKKKDCEYFFSKTCQVCFFTDKCESDFKKNDNSLEKSSRIFEEVTFKYISQQRAISKYGICESDLTGLQCWKRIPSPFSEDRKPVIRYRLADVEERVNFLKNRVSQNKGFTLLILNYILLIYSCLTYNLDDLTKYKSNCKPIHSAQSVFFSPCKVQEIQQTEGVSQVLLLETVYRIFMKLPTISTHNSP
jgi:hypothetical protein